MSEPAQLLAHELVHLLRLEEVSPFAASIGINPAFFLQHFFGPDPLAGVERRCAEQFEDGLYTVFIQVRNCSRELVGMAATLYNERLFDQPYGKTAADPKPEMIIFAGGERFVKESDRIEKPAGVQLRPTGLRGIFRAAAGNSTLQASHDIFEGLCACGSESIFPRSDTAGHRGDPKRISSVRQVCPEATDRRRSRKAIHSPRDRRCLVSGRAYSGMFPAKAAESPGQNRKRLDGIIRGAIVHYDDLEMLGESF